MKKVSIVFANEYNMDAMLTLKKSLEDIFEDYVEFKLCFADQFTEDTVLRDDACLMASEVEFEFLRHHVSDYTSIFTLERCLAKGALSDIMKLPAGTDVLVVNDGYDSSREVISNLTMLNVGHINMTPMKFALRHSHEYDNFHVAITPGCAEYVPAHINHIIDIGIRKISFSTIYSLIRFLNLDINKINRNLFRYIQTLTEPNTSSMDDYIFGYLKGELLDHFSANSDKATLLVDSRLRPVFASKQALSLFHESKTQNIRVQDVLDVKKLKEDESVILKIDDVNWCCDKYTFSILNDTIGYLLFFQSETERENASQQHKKKGHVAKYYFKDIIRNSPKMDELITKMKKIAPTDLTVMIRGESGTGKELLAHSIHNASMRSQKPFVAINCAALPETLLESELFGYMPGSFTGAEKKGKVGLFEQANHGTIFLDEIGDITPKLQTQLLRVLQEKQIMRVGGDRLIDIDVRLITATNKDLESAIEKGEFRQDLFFRLNVLSFQIPPLRERQEDIPLLMEYYLGDAAKRLPPEDMQILQNYSWPGNVRELGNIAQYYGALSTLPDYIYKDALSLTGEKREKLDSERELERTVLRLIAANTSSSHGIGRGAMLQILKERNVSVSDIHLRKILARLEGMDYLEIGKGRGGTRITEKGRDFLNS